MDHKMWAYMIYLGSNMWTKKETVKPYWVEPRLPECCYQEKMLTEKEIWRKVTDFLPGCGFNTLLIDIGEGVKLESYPQLAIPGSWEKQELKEELVRLREMGITPIPKLNFSSCHNAWMQEFSYMVGSEPYYKMCEEVVQELIELFGTPEFFHLGLDEELMPTPTPKYSPIVTVRSPRKQLEDANKLFKTCLEKGVRPWMWIDPPAIECFGGEESFQKHIPKEVLISNWYYGDLYVSKPVKNAELYNKLGEWGYDQMPTSSTCKYHTNIKQTMKYCKENVEPSSIKGYLTAPWIPTISERYYAHLSEAWVFKDAKEKIYPEER